jgi:hypothetical protein
MARLHVLRLRCQNPPANLLRFLYPSGLEVLACEF